MFMVLSVITKSVITTCVLLFLFNVCPPLRLSCDAVVSCSDGSARAVYSYVRQFYLHRNIYVHRTVTKFITHGSTCTFLVRYMKDNFPSPTAVICIGSARIIIQSPHRSLLAPPHITALPRIMICQSPLIRFPYTVIMTQVMVRVHPVHLTNVTSHCNAGAFWFCVIFIYMLLELSDVNQLIKWNVARVSITLASLVAVFAGRVYSVRLVHTMSGVSVTCCSATSAFCRSTTVSCIYSCF